MKASEAATPVSLETAATFLLDECRMVLPGIQALFGFQLIAVFNQRFESDLSPLEQRLHFAAIGLIALAIAIIMTPAAYHRRLGVERVTPSFIVISTRLLLASMAPLALALTMDFYIIGRLILGEGLPPLLTAALFACFVLLWWVLPRSSRLQHLLSH